MHTTGLEDLTAFTRAPSLSCRDIALHPFRKDLLFGTSAGITPIEAYGAVERLSLRVGVPLCCPMSPVLSSSLHHHTGGMFSRGQFRGTTTVLYSRSPWH
ncbi:hypothetical protein JAAARDRAFT_347262 [Jaapia argillacea MUCL 33604]|uniref:Uncharacterized protein n=1 Tax=Jaapia argillacea MUCL 33604 TaxID=933084 RepID=A0A067PTY0_9AGAM|nr:hypothetical protein JAAARDRAFT_347262 [Jaapia argillacea MUCL 33604]